VHERVVGELLRVAGVEADYAALGEEARVVLLRRELGGGRLLSNPYATYSDETAAEMAIVRAAAEVHALYGAEAITNYIISKAESVSDLLEVHILLKEAGLFRAGDPPAAAIMVRAAVRNDRRSRKRARRDDQMVRPARGGGDHGGARASGSDGRLFGFEQGRRLSHLGVEPPSGEPRAGAGVRAGGRRDAAFPRAGRRGRGGAAAPASRRSARSRRAR